MKQLIISDYDCATGFSWVVLENGVEIDKSEQDDLYKSLKKFGLFNEEWWCPSYGLATPSNELLKGFDQVIICDNGSIDIINLTTEEED
jgi:hypothetical protein